MSPMIESHFSALSQAVDHIGPQAPRLAAWGRRLAEVLTTGGRLLACGNGGSAAEAQHLTAELVGRFRDERTPLSAISLHADTSALTAIANDYGVDEMFARGVRAHGRPGDVLVTLSTSGTSPNVLAAVKAGHETGLTTWAFTGPQPNPLAAMCDDAVCVDAPTTATVQEIHLLLVHALCIAVDGELLEQAMSKPLVIVGDSMLDVDIDGSATRLSPEAPVPVVDAERVWQRPGGAGLAALLAARSGHDVVLVTAVADDADGRALTGLLTEAGVRVVGMKLSGATVCKTRIRAGGQSMLRLDHGDGSAAGEPLPANVADVLGEAAAICAADYGRGVTAHDEVRRLLTRAAERLPVVWDPHPRGTDPVPGCWLVTPNQDEARTRSAESLRRQWSARAVCVTLGAKGALLAIDGAGTSHHPVPDTAAHAGRGDTCGAGDRFAIAATLSLAAGRDIAAAVTDAVEAASRFVAAGGAVGVSSAAPVRQSVSAATESTAVVGSAAEVRDRFRRSGGTLVATGGCFDLLHTGHVRLLRQARQLGDALVVLLNSDSSVRALKGPRRPVMADVDRARVLAALACVDAVVIFDDLSPEAALDELRPDVWVKGGDYTEADLPEANVIRRHGGEVVLLPTVAGYSSSNLIAAARS